VTKTQQHSLIKLVFKYPVLKSFYQDVKKTDDGVEIFCFYDFSQEECENGNQYYVQLVLSYDIVGKELFYQYCS